MEDKIYTYIFYDILDKVLQLSENPSQFSEYLTHQISELIGARTVVIAVKDKAEKPAIFSVFPTRRKEWCNQPVMLQFAEHSLSFDKIKYLSNEAPDEKIEQFFKHLEIEKAIAIPLIAGNRIVGSILLLDIMDLFGIDTIIDLLTRLSGVFALVIRNSLLYHNLEDLVARRTNELQIRNEELLEQEKQLKSANEEYEALNEELSENITKAEEINEQLEEAKEQVEESEKKFKAFFNSNPSSTFVWKYADDDFILIETNETANKTTGDKAKEFIGLLASQIYVDLPYIREKLFACYNTKSVDEFEYHYKVRYSGAYEWIKFKLAYVEPNIILLYTETITKQKNSAIELQNAKEKAEESELKLIEAQELSHVGSWEYIIDTDTVIWSKELYNIFERSYDLPAPKYSEQHAYYIEESFIILDKAVQDCVQREMSYEIELDIKTSSGSVKQIISKGNVIKDKSNKVIGCYGTAQDITQKKKIEQDLILAKEKAEESDRLKTAFLENISHEVRTPMNSILGFSKLLLKQNLTDEKRKQFTDVLQKATHQLLTVVDNTITLAHIETKQLRLNRMVFWPTALLASLFNDYNIKKQLINKDHIQLIKSDNGFTDLSINNDYTRINEIFTILLDNALKFTEKGTIEFGYKLLETGHEKSIQFYVKDTGIGIPPEKQQIIFKSFTQSDKNTRQLYGGLGVGLSIAMGLIKLLNGKLTINSEMNLGTEIIFSLLMEDEVNSK